MTNSTLRNVLAASVLWSVVALGKTAAASNGWALVYANGNPTSWNYNSQGGLVVTSRLAAGQYEVDFTNMPHSATSIGHVTAFGGPNYCKLYASVVGNSTTTKLLVDCFTPQGALADTEFVAFVEQPDGFENWGAGGFESVAGGTSPYLAASWNSSGGTNSVTWNSSNSTYTISMPGIGTGNASVQVTAFGGQTFADDGHRCNIVSWSVYGGVTVKCYSANGTPTAGQFNVSYIRAMIPQNAGGNAWVPQGAVSSYYRSATGVSNCSFPTITSSATSTVTTVTMPDAVKSSSTEVVPLVTSHGGADNHCSITSWYVPSGTTSIAATVECFDNAGNLLPVSSPQNDFSIAFASRTMAECIQ